MARLERERAKYQDELEKRIANKPKPVLDAVCADFGKAVAKFRRRVGLTQVKLGELCKMPQSEIGRIESGRHNLTLKKAKRIAEALNRKLKITIE